MANGVSRAVIEVVLDRVHQGAVTLSPEAQLTYANQRFASMLGRGRAQLIGKPLAELVAGADRETLASALAAGADGAAKCRLALPRAGGGELQALLTFAPLGHGQASCLITDLSQGAQALALAHEMRNILGTLRNSVDLLKRSALDAEGQRALEAIEQQGARIVELLNAKE
jgi:nitrogen-specific signal transduction histidine kinase